MPVAGWPHQLADVDIPPIDRGYDGARGAQLGTDLRRLTTPLITPPALQGRGRAGRGEAGVQGSGLRAAGAPPALQGSERAEVEPG